MSDAKCAHLNFFLERWPLECMNEIKKVVTTINVGNVRSNTFNQIVQGRWCWDKAVEFLEIVYHSSTSYWLALQTVLSLDRRRIKFLAFPPLGFS